MDYNNLQQSLEVTSVDKLSKEKESKHFGNPSYAASFGNGRLGNQICNLASLYAIYKEFNIPCYVSQYSYRTMRSAFALNEGSGNDSRKFMNIIDSGKVSSLSWVYISNYDLMLRRNE